MRIAFASALAALLLTAPLSPVFALAAAKTCTANAAALPPELDGWCATAPAAAASAANNLASAKIEIGRAYDASLVSTADVRYIAPPEKSGGPASFGGLFTFDVIEAGNYRVALNSGAWIDLLRDGKAVTSNNHAHGPDGSGVRKLVDFPLSPGRHILQLAANGEPRLQLMFVRLP